LQWAKQNQLQSFQIDINSSNSLVIFKDTDFNEFKVFNSAVMIQLIEEIMGTSRRENQRGLIRNQLKRGQLSPP
jgi:hypothetical protein